MASPKFHVAIDSPPGTTFPSFPSSAMEGGDVTKITLDMIRNKCSISNKFFFTVDGKSRVDDTTTLGYYMSLTAEGQTLLQPPPKTPTSNNNSSNNSSNNNASKDPPPPAPGVPTFLVKIADSTVKQDLANLPAKNEALAKLLGDISTSPLTRDALPTFADRQLTSLLTNYATTVAAGRVYSYAEPSELTELQWDSVLRNNRALNGYWYDFKLGMFMTAPKQAFRLRGSAPVGKPPTTSTASAPTQQYLPPIPPYYVHDRASVKVIEVRSQEQDTWIKEGFNSIAVGGSLGGGPASVPASVEASWEKEHAYANQKREAKDVQSLAVTYNFPRAVIEFDTDTLELTDQCRQDALKVTTIATRDRFFREYGTIFVTRLTLGGFLYSTRSVKASEKANLDQVKDTTRIAAGISAQTPKASGGINIAKVDSTSTETGSASLLQDVCLTWDAMGGDTLLCTNCLRCNLPQNGPPAWANTVKDHRLWRLMNKERLVSLEHLLQALDTEAHHRLSNPSAQSNTGRDVLKDQDFQDYVRTLIIEAVMSGKSRDGSGGAVDDDDNTIVRKMADAYATDTAAKLAAYNAWMKANFPDERSAIIPGGVIFEGLKLDQKVGFGLWMASKGELTFA